ncbi:hypothetical protein INS49_012011 [Diaporthe citri]|uniref:uncharacterized protein n=1 Tax=Diaporthe citri TaxID=83186 RepID=UPI001C81FB33|nr:uncharacterized protein INS49_012011 [Diaporthe citri]KAG6360943.1 hypothetical protein INS49_012011 [Diaporthe citri]
MDFLTSHRALRPRSMVVNLRMTIDIKKSLPLFDTGHTIRQSKGKLIKMNVPTALRCMKVNGRLSEVEFLIDNSAATDGVEQDVPNDHLPMAEIQLVSRSGLSLIDYDAAHSSPRVRPDIQQAVTVIAPAFLACRAWQSGFLPLFENGTFEKGTSLGLMRNRHRSDQKQIAGEDSGEIISRVDGDSLMRYWLGGTIVELLDETVQPSSWIDPFTLSAQRGDDLKDIASSIASHRSEHLLHKTVMVDSIEDENGVAESSAKATNSSFESAWKTEETGHKEPQSVMNLQRRLEDARLVCSTGHDAPGPSKGYNAPSNDGSLSDEIEMRTLHQRFGISSKARENMASISPSYSESPTRSELIGGIASPSSNSELEGCWMVSRRSVSLGEDYHVDSSAACSTADSSGQGQGEEEAQEPPMLHVRTPYEGLSAEKHDVYTDVVVEGVPAKLSKSLETTKDQLSRSFVLDRVESEVKFGNCGTFLPVGENAELRTWAKKAAKKARKESKKRKREARTKAGCEDVGTGQSIGNVSQAPGQVVPTNELKLPMPKSGLALQESKLRSTKARHPCSASTEMARGQAEKSAAPVTPKTRPSKKRKGQPSQDESAVRPQSSNHGRTRARKVKDKQLELLGRLEAEAWERERTLVR